jgi:hypothetical protein
VHFNGEDKKKGRLRVDTLSTWLMPHHHDSGRGGDRRQFFFWPRGRP